MFKYQLLTALWVIIPVFEAIADYKNNPPPVPGFTHPTAFPDDTPQKHGLIVSGNDIVYSSPVIADVDDNPENGKEVVVGSQDGTLYVYNKSGVLLWEKNLPNKGCGEESTTNQLFSSPTVADLDNDGKIEVIVSYGGLLDSRSCDGGIIAYRGSDGKKRWKYSVKAQDNKDGITEVGYGVFGSPVVFDTDNDGKLEVAFGAFDRNYYLLNHKLKLKWSAHAADTVWSSPTFMFLPGEDTATMFIGTDITENHVINPPTSNGGYMYALRTAPADSSVKRFGFRDERVVKWQVHFDQAIWSSPVLADVITSKSGPELIFLSGSYFPENLAQKNGRWIKIMNPRNGKVLKTLKFPPGATASSSSVAIGDINEDGVLDIVGSLNGDVSLGGDGFSRVVAWSGNTGRKIWSKIVKDRGNNDPFGGHFVSPIIGDVDGNGSLEVLISNFWSVHVLAGKTGAPLTCMQATCSDESLGTMFGWKTLKGTPNIGDVNNDGVIELFIGGGHVYSPTSRGMIYGFTSLADIIQSEPGIHPPYFSPWRMHRGNEHHDGVYRE